MASEIKKDLLCPVCCDIYKDPITLSCDHSFCQSCLWAFWEDGQTSECPLCKRRSSKKIPPFNFTLKTECDAARTSAAASQQVCSLHSEKLSFFCLDDQQLICSVCKDSGTHSEHKIQITDEASRDLKQQLQDSLKPFQKKLRHIRQVKGSCEQTADRMKVQADSMVRRIKEEFRRLRQFLDEEEEARLAALREEKEEKTQMMKEKIDALSREISALSGVIRDTEKKLKAQHVSFLQSYKETVGGVEMEPLPDELRLISGALINEAKHLGNLSFSIWIKMKKLVSYSPVILDPNTAHPDLTLSEDLTSLKKGDEKQELPDNPERFDHFISVTGSEGFTSGRFTSGRFTSGRHSWEVEVGDNDAYVLGMITESNSRKGGIWSGLWRLMFCGGEYKTLSPSDTGSDVSVSQKPRRIRLLLDYDRGQLSYIDAESNTHIHTFTHTFSHRLFPYISTWSRVPIKIKAQEISVSAEQH